MAPRARPDQEVQVDRAATEPDEEGGDPACWLSRVCVECGRVSDEEPPTRCAGCGAVLTPA